MIKSPVLLLAFAGTALTARSQTVSAPSSPTALPEVTVTAASSPSSSPTLTVPTMEQAEEEVKLTPGGASITDAESYKKGHAATLKDALDFTPGVYAQPRFGSEEARISIRGSGIQRTFHGRGLKVLQDGIPLNLADGGFDMQAIDPLAAEYIEVYRGANALRYGGTTLGGSVNFISPTGYTAPGFQAAFEYGSWDSMRAQISTAGVEGPMDWYATVTESYTNGYRDHSEQNNQRFFGNFGYKISDVLETRFYLTYAHSESELPGNLSWDDLKNNPRLPARAPFFRIVDVVDSDWERNFDLFRIANKTTLKLDSDSQISLSSFYSHKELDHPILFVIDQRSDDFGIDLNYHTSASLAGRRNDFTLGFAPTFGFVRDQRYENDLGHRGDKISDDRSFAANLDLYLENVHYLTDRFAVVAGGSVSYAVRNNEDRFADSIANSPNNVDQDFWGFSPKLGFLYDVNDHSQIYFNASRSFEPPSFGELVGGGINKVDITQLDAQTATTLELGTRGRTAGNRIKWDLAYYYAWLDDELMEYEIAPGLTQTVNAGRTIHQGIELGLDIALFEGILTGNRPAAALPVSTGKSPVSSQPVLEEPAKDRLVLRQNYLWNGFHYDSDPAFGDNELPGIPPHYYRAELMYEHPCGFFAGPDIEWAFEGFPVDSANTVYTDSYVLLGAKIGFRTKKGVSFHIDARNLTDERYAATTSVVSRFNPFSPAVFSPGNGRSFYAGVEYKF